MDRFESNKIPDEYVTLILQFIGEHQTAIAKVCPNPVIRDDIFNIFTLLVDDCTVIYYPIDDRNNNGFHVDYTIDGRQLHFVYINTNQHTEKQIFTAAHELGHIWALDRWLEEKGVSFDYEMGERLMNRFAAELLMPKVLFKEFAKKEIESNRSSDGKISIGGMISAVTSIMNEFFTSYKSVVYRLYELDMISPGNAHTLWGDNLITKETIKQFSKKAASEQGYSRLYQADERRWIAGLKELLDEAAKLDNMPENWLVQMSENFKLTIAPPSDAMIRPLPEAENEEGEQDA